jgi:hypothetical protein
MLRMLLCLAACALLAGGPGAVAQTTLNPDISANTRFLVETDDGAKLNEGKREFSKPDLQFQELELGLQAYLNPYARGDIFLSIQGPDVESAKLGLEEAYVTVLRGLPLDLNLRAGKYRVEFGKLNMIHPHGWAFITQPLVEQRFLGEDGLNDLGLSVSALLPTGGVYTRLTVDVLRGLSVPAAAGIEDTTGAKPLYAFSGRLSSFFTLDDFRDVEVGLSGYTGIQDPYSHERFWYANVDFKYKYRPGTYTSLVVQGEFLLNRRSASQNRQFVPFLDAAGNPEVKTITSSGLYLFADYQFMKIFSVGARYDWAEDPYGADDRASAIGVFLGYYPVDETLALRLQYQNTNTATPGTTRAVNYIGLQLMFSLGPHKAHPF